MSDSIPDPSTIRLSREDIEKVYVESSETISLSELARRTGRSKSVLHAWKHKYFWDKKREDFQKCPETYQSKIYSTISDSTIVKETSKNLEKIERLINVDAAGLALEHLFAYQKFRKFTELILAQKIKQVNESQNPTEEIRKISIKNLSLLSQIADRSIKGEREAIGLQLQIDPSMAIASLENMGYVVIDPNDSIETIPTE